MVNRTKRCFVLLFVLLFALVPFRAFAADYEEETLSPHIAVYNTQVGVFVYQKDASERVTPAPAKLMTALIAMEYFAGRLQSTVTVTSSALKNLEGSAVLNLKSGEVIAVEHLLHAVLVAGMSDAANALAIEIAGSIPAFVKLMNEKAAELGMEDTLFTTANGLEMSGSHTTAADTALLAAAIYENADLREIATKRYYIVPATNIHESVTIYTKNMLISPQSEYYDKNAIGISAGYTDAGGYSVIAAAEGNFPYICVTLGSEKTDGGKIGGYLDTKKLLSWAVGNFAELKILDSARIIAEIPVSGGRDTDHVLLVPDAAVYAFLDADTDLSAIVLSPTYEESLTAPVEKGRTVGEVLIVLDGDPIGSAKLVTKSAVKQSGAAKLWDTIGKIFPVLLILIAVLAVFMFIGKRQLRKSSHKPSPNTKY